MRSWTFYTKIWTVILLGLSINLPLLITKNYLELQRKTVRRAVKAKINEGLKDSELIRLAFEKSSFESKIIWHKADEFEYKNIMYDIVRQLPSQDSIIYMCWQDDDESIIKRKLNELSSLEWYKNRTKDKQKERQLEFYKNLICTNHKVNYPELPQIIWLPKNNITYLYPLIGIDRNRPSTPPPQIT